MIQESPQPLWPHPFYTLVSSNHSQVSTYAPSHNHVPAPHHRFALPPITVLAFFFLGIRPLCFVAALDWPRCSTAFYGLCSFYLGTKYGLHFFLGFQSLYFFSTKYNYVRKPLHPYAQTLPVREGMSSYYSRHVDQHLFTFFSPVSVILHRRSKLY